MKSHPTDRPSRPGPLRPALALACALAAGCGGDDGTGPNGLRYGQIGEVRLTLETPRHLGEGTLEQRLVWSSDGPYSLVETISYDGEVGDRTFVGEQRNPEILAGLYAGWIIQVNEAPALQLLRIVDTGPAPDCNPGRTRITLEIFDDVQEGSVRWIRCADGSLGSLTTTRAGPDEDAARVVQAAIFLRNETVGESFTSTYQGSLPFATVARGEDSGTLLTAPRAITETGDWEAFWAQHSGGMSQPPAVDFSEDVVLVAVVGERQEAGETVEIRRILPTGERTFAEVFELVPGNFCSPVARSHVPFHIVRAPRFQLPVVFLEPRVEPVPCGG